MPIAPKPAFSTVANGWLVLTVVLLSLTAGYSLYLVKLDKSLQTLAGEHNYLLGQASSFFSAELGDVRHTTVLLGMHLQDLVNNTDLTQGINNALIRVGKGHSAISQLRWLSPSGMERYRVDFDGNNAVAVPESKLQDKSHRGYFRKASSLSPGEILLSPIDLNVENGRVQTPFEPTIRGILRAQEKHPLGDGYLVVNFALTELFSQLKQLSSERSRLIIASGSDRWLLHPENIKEWSPDLDNPPHNLPLDKPQLFRTLQDRAAVSLFRNSDNAVFSGHRLQLNTGLANLPTTLYFLANTPNHVFSDMKKEAVLPATGLGVIMLIVGGLFYIREQRNKYRLKALSAQLRTDKEELMALLKKQNLLQEELVESEKMASLGMLVAGVSHELSTPIGGAVMSVSSIQQRTEELSKKVNNALSKRQLEEYLEHCKHSSQLAMENLNRSGELIKRFKRLAVDRGNEDAVSFDLASNVDDLIRSLGPLLKKRQTKIDVTIPDNIVMVSYPGVLSQVLQNLITNCIDHANTNDKALRIYLNASLQSGQVTITVRDNGSGIDESVRDRVFEPFITTARGKGNSGLGLHLLYQWVTKVLEGHITLDSSKEGTLFILCLPQNTGTT